MNATLQQQEGISIPKLLLTVSEAAQVLSLSRAYFYPMVMSGKIASIKIGNIRRIPFAALQVFIEQLMLDQKREENIDVK